MQPKILGPAVWPAAGPPPEFTVEPGMLLFMVELAAARCLMTSVDDRTPDNYFFGGEEEGVFATGPGWHVPAEVWDRLCHTPVLYYRVIAVDQSGGVSALSVGDENLDALPEMVVQHGSG